MKLLYTVRYLDADQSCEFSNEDYSAGAKEADGK